MDSRATGLFMVISGALLLIARREFTRISLDVRGMGESWYRPALWLTVFVAVCLVAFGALQLLTG